MIHPNRYFQKHLRKSRARPAFHAVKDIDTSARGLGPPGGPGHLHKVRKRAPGRVHAWPPLDHGSAAQACLLGPCVLSPKTQSDPLQAKMRWWKLQGLFLAFRTQSLTQPSSMSCVLIHVSTHISRHSVPSYSFFSRRPGCLRSRAILRRSLEVFVLTVPPLGMLSLTGSLSSTVPLEVASSKTASAHHLKRNSVTLRYMNVL